MLVNGWAVNAVVVNGGAIGGSGGGGGGSGGTIGRYVNGLDVDAIFNDSGRSKFFRARIADADGVIKDYSTRSGINWCHSLEYSDSVDSVAMSATVKLLRQKDQKSLAPLKTGSSYNQTPFLEADLSLGVGPAIDIGRVIIIDVADVPLGTLMTTIAEEDWHRVFEGLIDVVDWSKNPIELSCMGRGVELTDTWFPLPNTIVPDPANIQGALAELLDLAHLDVFTQLYVPVAPDPEVVVGAFSYAIETAWDALSRVAQINGWDLRYRYSDLYQEFRLTFKDPGRGRTDPDFVLYPKSYVDVTQLKIDRSTIRNDVAISYRPDNDTGTPRLTVYLYNPESVRRYGRRSMVIQEADDSPINSADSANLMAQLIVYDLAQPQADKTIDMPYAWFLELGNLIRFPANLVHSDETLNLFVVGVKHVLTDKLSRSYVTLRGTPGSYWKWFGRRPVVPGGGVPTDPEGTSTAGGFASLSQTPDYGTDHVQFDWAWGGDVSATFDVYAQRGTGGFSLAGSTVAGVTTLDFDTGTDIEPFHTPPDTPQLPVTISFYVIASVSGVVAATSRTSVASYGEGP